MDALPRLVDLELFAGVARPPVIRRLAAATAEEAAEKGAAFGRIVVVEQPDDPAGPLEQRLDVIV
jgi:hypothetical protein